MAKKEKTIEPQEVENQEVEKEASEVQKQYPTIAHKVIAEHPSKEDEPTFYVSKFGVSLTKEQIEILNKEDGINIVLSRKNK
jgi:hypothetical protein